MSEESDQVHDIPPRPSRLKDRGVPLGAPPSGDTADYGRATSEEMWRYSMGRECKGLFVIFNHEKFETELHLEERLGTEKDKQDMKKVWQDLGFRVKIHDDLKHDEILKKIEKYSIKTDHSLYDCFGCAILTHGEKDDLLYAKDKIYPIQEVLEPFRNCKSLFGKPKLFFIQACRGQKVDSGNKMNDTTDNGPSDGGKELKLEEFKIPREADFLIAHSTVPGYYSWRNPKEGSWFIQMMNNCLQKYAPKYDLMTILTAVNREVSTRESSTDLMEYHGKKQCPSLVSRLTGLLYLGNGVPDAAHAPTQASVSDPQLMSAQSVQHVVCEQQWTEDEYYSLKLGLLKKKEEMIRLKENLYRMKLRKPKFQV